MNADDMSKPVFGSFYLRSASSKAVPVHTTPLVGAQRRESPANIELLHTSRKLELFNSADLGDRQNRFLLFLFRVPHSQSFGLKNCKRQNHDRNGLWANAREIGT